MFSSVFQGVFKELLQVFRIKPGDFVYFVVISWDCGDCAVMDKPSGKVSPFEPIIAHITLPSFWLMIYQVVYVNNYVSKQIYASKKSI